MDEQQVAEIGLGCVALELVGRAGAVFSPGAPTTIFVLVVPTDGAEAVRH